MGKMITLGLAFITLFLTSCEKLSKDNNSIIGQWQWIKSSFGDRSNTISSQSVDSTYFIEFDNQGSYYYYNNSKNLISSHKYELKSGNQFNTYKLIDSNPDLIYGYSIDNDTLSIWRLNDLTDQISIYLRFK